MPRIDKNGNVHWQNYADDEYELGYQQGRADAIDEFVEILNNIFEYRHDMAEIRKLAEKLKEQKNE